MTSLPPRLCVRGVVVVGRVFVSVDLRGLVWGGPGACSGPVCCGSGGPAVDLRDALSPWGARYPLSEQGYADDDRYENGDATDRNAKRGGNVEATVRFDRSLLYVVLQSSKQTNKPASDYWSCRL